MKIKKCPVCSKQYIKQGLKNHIINTAKSESFKHINDILDVEKTNHIVLFKCSLHLKYYRKNCHVLPNKTKTLKYHLIK